MDSASAHGRSRGPVPGGGPADRSDTAVRRRDRRIDADIPSDVVVVTVVGMVFATGVGDDGVVGYDVSGGVGVVRVDGVRAADHRWSTGQLDRPVDRVAGVDGSVDVTVAVVAVGHVHDNYSGTGSHRWLRYGWSGPGLIFVCTSHGYAAYWARQSQHVSYR